jgi:hypothetical protein
MGSGRVAAVSATARGGRCVGGIGDGFAAAVVSTAAAAGCRWRQGSLPLRRVRPGVGAARGTDAQEGSQCLRRVTKRHKNWTQYSTGASALSRNAPQRKESALQVAHSRACRRGASEGQGARPPAGPPEKRDPPIKCKGTGRGRDTRTTRDDEDGVDLQDALQDDLLGAVRRGDAAGVGRLLAAGAPARPWDRKRPRYSEWTDRTSPLVAAVAAGTRGRPPAARGRRPPRPRLRRRGTLGGLRRLPRPSRA